MSAMPESVTSNGLPLPIDARHTGALESTPLSAIEDGSLVERLKRDGYVLLRGLLDRDEVLAQRARYFEACGEGFVKDGDFRRGAWGGASPALPAHGTVGHPAHAFARSAEFIGFVESPVLRRVAELVLGTPARRLRRTPVRSFVPGRRVASRAHRDQSYISSPVGRVATFWVPLGDCPIAAGGLVYLEGSHEWPDFEASLGNAAPNDRPQDRRPITHDLKWLSEHTGARWLLTDYQAGDVVLHTPDIVHASLDATGELMRLSTDVRYIPADAEPDAAWRSDWAGDDGY